MLRMEYVSCRLMAIRVVMVIVVGNGDSSSNPDRVCISHCANTLGTGMHPTILPLAIYR